MQNNVVMSREELLDAMKTFSIAYDIVRFVEPNSTKVMCYDGEEYKEAQFEPCFAVWEKGERCENCISLRACIEKRRMSKFEFRNEEAYHVVSIPILLIDGEQKHQVALELVNRVSENTIFQATGDSEIVQEIQRLNNRAYIDSLTGVFNRRYYDENRHIFEANHALPKKIAYLLADINRFKSVNDTFGHAHGDELLTEVAKALRQNIREQDVVMRIGGDEFLMVLRDCSELVVEKKIEQLKQSVSEISLDWMGGYIPSIAVGMSYMKEFDGDEAQLEELFREADELMYENKMQVTKSKKR